VHCLCDSCHKEQHTKDRQTGETPLENLISTIAKHGVSPEEAKMCFLLGRHLSTEAGYDAFIVLDSFTHKKLVNKASKFIDELTTEYINNHVKIKKRG
jgi:hypothetical protein